MITAKNRYQIHKHSAKSRGIDFEITYEEWTQWWLSHGVDKNHPSIPGPYRPCMCRFNDTGPYRLDNIYFDTISNNVRDGQKKRDYTTIRKPVHTPLGDFDSTTKAAIAMGCHRKYIYTRIKQSDPDYYFI